MELLIVLVFGLVFLFFAAVGIGIVVKIVWAIIYTAALAVWEFARIVLQIAWAIVSLPFVILLYPFRSRR